LRESSDVGGVTLRLRFSGTCTVSFLVLLALLGLVDLRADFFGGILLDCLSVSIVKTTDGKEALMLSVDRAWRSSFPVRRSMQYRSSQIDRRSRLRSWDTQTNRYTPTNSLASAWLLLQLRSPIASSLPVCSSRERYRETSIDYKEGLLR